LAAPRRVELFKVLPNTPRLFCPPRLLVQMTIHGNPAYMQTGTFISNSRKRSAEVARDNLKTGARMWCRVFR